MTIVDAGMMTMIMIIGLISIYVSMMTSLIVTFMLTLGYGLLVIFTGTMDQFDPVSVNYYYLVVPSVVCVLTGIIGFANENYLRASSSFKEEYEELVRIDDLTGFRNRKEYDLSLISEVERAKRYSQDLSLMVIHIESFDDLNHLYGLSQGEKFIKHLSDFVIETTRLSDQHYRIEHNVFALILPNTNADGAALLKERFIKEFESLNIVVKSNQQKLSIEIDIVYESYKSDMTADEFQKEVLDKLEVEPRGGYEEDN